jgi:hypothetical protein
MIGLISRGVVMLRPALIFATAICFVAPASTVCASVLFNQSVTPDVLFGSGNANGSFSTNDTTISNIEIGLRAKQRFPAANIFNNNLNGTYSFATGIGIGGPGTPAFPRPLWNFEWSINTDLSGLSGVKLDGLTYQIRIDYDPSPIGTNFQSFDPINVALADHAIGDNTTGNGGGSVAANAAAYAGLISTKNVAQNSWSLSFFDDATHIIDPNVDGTYTIQLEALIPGAAPILASIDVIVGTGSPVPEPIAFLTWAGLIGCAAVAARPPQR